MNRIRPRTALLLFAALMLNFQEVVLVRKICCRDTPAGTLKIGSLLDFHCRETSECAGRSRRHGVSNPDSALLKFPGLENGRVHHLDIPVLGDWIPRIIRPVEDSDSSFPDRPFLSSAAGPAPRDAGLLPVHPRSGAPPPIPPEDQTSLLLC